MGVGIVAYPAVLFGRKSIASAFCATIKLAPMV